MDGPGLDAHYVYHAPTAIRSGPGAFGELPEQLARHGKRPCIVFGRRFAQESGLVERVRQTIPNALIHTGIGPNPTSQNCESLAERCRAGNCDALAAIGGGSVIDAAKAAAALARNPGPCSALYGAGALENGALPVIAVPTTAGTGSETTPYAVLVDAAARVKRTIAGPALFPRAALLDPCLLDSLPAEIARDTGLDVLSQGMEAYLSRKATPLSDTLALEVCRLVRDWLPRAAAGHTDRQARGAMLHAAALSGMAIAQTGTTLVHGMGYPLTLELGIPHGRANALLLAPVFRYNALHEPGRVARLAEVFGCPAPPEPGPAAAAIASALDRLFHALGWEARLDADPGTLNAFAGAIADDPYRFKNQCGAPGKAEVFAFFEEARTGVRHPWDAP